MQEEINSLKTNKMENDNVIECSLVFVTVMFMKQYSYLKMLYFVKILIT